MATSELETAITLTPEWNRYTMKLKIAVRSATIPSELRSRRGRWVGGVATDALSSTRPCLLETPLSPRSCHLHWPASDARRDDSQNRWGIRGVVVGCRGSRPAVAEGESPMTVTLARSWPRTVALVLVVLTACGSESATKSRGGGGEGGGSGSDELATIAGALATVPASSELDEVDELVWGDVGQAAKIAGLEPPDDPTDLDAVDAYLNALEAFPVDKGVYPLLPEVADAIGGLGMPELVEEEGWS